MRALTHQEGAFFGEIPILSPNNPHDGSETIGAEVRVRSVRAVTDCELCYIERADMRAIQRTNAELQIRILRFARVNKGSKGIKQVPPLLATCNAVVSMIRTAHCSFTLASR